MKIMFERAILVNRAADISAAADRIYLGNEFCQHLIPQLDNLKEWFFLVKSKKKEFTFVTPFVTNPGLKKLARVLSFLNTQKDVEVVFNDLGVFKLIRDEFPNLKPVLGRLLSKQRRDPRILKILLGQQKTRVVISPDKSTKTVFYPQKVPAAFFEHHRGCLINVPIFGDYLLNYGISRVEIDNLVWEMKVKVRPGIKVSLYLPYGYIATTRMCGKLTLSYAACKKECKKYFIQLTDESLPVPFYGIGNTVFYKTQTPSDQYLEKLGIDRIVYQPRLPF